MCGRAGACEGPPGRVHRFFAVMTSGSVLAVSLVGMGRSGRVWAAGMWLSSSWSRGERGGRGSGTVPVTIEEPVLVPMSEAERAAAVSVLADILRDWWVKHGGGDLGNGSGSCSARP